MPTRELTRYTLHFSARRRLLRVSLLAIACAAVSGSSRRDTNEIITLNVLGPPYRSAEGRLSGFDYRPLQPTTVPVVRTADLAAAVGRIIRRTRTERTVGNLHALGVARAIRGEWDSAVQNLSDALAADTAGQSTNAAILNDLAVVLHARAAAKRDPRDDLRSARLAERAWTLQPSAAAAWNRAVASEALLQRQEAETAWADLLRVERDPAWLRDAKVRIDRLRRPSESDLWTQAKRRLYDATAYEVVDGIVRQFPQQSRLEAENGVLASWADGTADAAQMLRVARWVGQSLSRRSDEHLILDAVAAIDQASASGLSRKHAVLAHKIYNHARQEYARCRGAAARRLFAAAEKELAKFDSPFRYLAVVYGATTFYCDNDYRALDTAVKQMPPIPPTYHAATAQASWVIGLANLALGRPDAAVSAYGVTLSEYRRLNEIDSQMAAHNLLAEAYGYLDDDQAAWRERSQALELLSKSGPFSARYFQVLHGYGRAAAAAGEWGVAAGAFDRAYALALKRSASLDLFEAEAWRTYVRYVTSGRADSWDAAERLLTGAGDEKTRQREAAMLGVLKALTMPAEMASIATIDQSLQFARGAGDRYTVPRLLIHRGRVHRANGRFREALRDFDLAIVESSADRAGDHGGRYGIANRQVVTEATALGYETAHALGDSGWIYRSSEAAAEFLLPGPRNRTHPPSSPAVPPGVLIVKYVVVGPRLMIWTISTSGTRLSESTVARDAFDQPADFERLWRSLIDPIGDLAKAETLIFVRDAVTDPVPFAALRNPRTGRYLIEAHRIGFAPTVRACLNAFSARPINGQVLIAAPASSVTGSLPLLVEAAAEARDLARLYAGSKVMGGSGFSKSELFEQMPRAGLVHFAGHGMEDRRNHLLSRIVLRDDGKNREVAYAHEIAALRLSGVRLVMLSSCVGGAAPIIRAQRSSSLAEAFLAAGVQAVVASSSPVPDDVARQFAVALHRRLRAGETVGDAVRRLQIDRFRDRSPGNLVFWSSFKVFGNPNANIREWQGREKWAQNSRSISMESPPSPNRKSVF